MKQITRHTEADSHLSSAPFPEDGHYLGRQWLVFTTFFLTTCLCACHTTVNESQSTHSMGKEIRSSGQPGKTTFHIEGTRVKSVDVHSLGSYTNTAFREADFPGGRIIE